MHRRMFRIRRFEELASQLYRDGEIPGFLHLSIGQEATAVGACWSLRATDAIVSTHRGHGHSLAKGADMTAMFAELFGRDTGTCKGRGGSMHIADLSAGVYGANGIVGAGLPIAVGVANSFRQQNRDDVVVAFFGDGAVAQGAFHESMNLASLWKLPVIFMCENNGYAEFSSTESQHPVDIPGRAKAYGMRAISVDGNDVVEVASVIGNLLEDRLQTELPLLVEAVTFRDRGHYEGDPQRYRPDADREGRPSDPIARSRSRLESLGMSEALVVCEAEVEDEISAAVAAARVAPEPNPTDLFDFTIVQRSTPLGAGTVEGDEVFRVMDAVHDALDYELANDPTVFLAGIDVGQGGNIFGITRGLYDRYPDRVMDTPICETALMGLAIGGALAGSKPVVELMYFDFIGVCFDQILNQAAKFRYMTGGMASVPLVIRTQFGAGRSSGAQHSQSLEALLAHIPGLTVIMPSTPADAYGLLRSAIQDPNPVIFIEHRLQYGKKGPKPSADHLVPIGSAAVRRSGTDVTVVTWSRMTDDVLIAAEEAETLGVSVEVIELRTIVPLDEATVLTSVMRTGRVLVAHEAVMHGGFGAEIVSQVADRAFWFLDAPVRRLGAEATPSPYAPSLEQAWLPNRDSILREILDLAAA